MMTRPHTVVFRRVTILMERDMWMHDRPGGSLETSGCSVASLARPVFRASMLVQLWVDSTDMEEVRGDYAKPCG
jgi:hypothetical protein